MSLKVSLLAFGAGVAIVTGLTAYTSYQFEQQLQRGLTQQQAQLQLPNDQESITLFYLFAFL